MQLFKNETHIDFMGLRKSMLVVSVLLILVSIASLAIRGLNFGIDFTGGTLIEVGYAQNAELGAIRDLLDEKGYKDVTVQHFGTAKDVLIRIAPEKDVSSAELSDQVFLALKQAEPEVDLRRVAFVGPQVGDELANDGGLAMLYALMGILIYVSLRFQWRMSVGSIAALVHDVTITLGVFSLLQLEFDLTVLAAVLAVIGYSLNDTIVVFDRIRENFRMIRKGTPAEVMNISINQTLARTLMTSVTTLLVLLALFVFGGELIHGFATALIVGILVGTYSSIFVASPAALYLGISREDLLPPEKEGENLDEMP